MDLPDPPAGPEADAKEPDLVLTLTFEQILAALAKSLRGVQDLDEKLKAVFDPPESTTSLRLR